MEKEKERVLAYRVSKLINFEQLSEVGGGANMCHRETLKPSGGTGGMDIFIDVTVDF